MSHTTSYKYVFIRQQAAKAERICESFCRNVGKHRLAHFQVDPTLTRADRLVGQVLGEVGALPDVFTEVEINFFLLRRLLGVRTQVCCSILPYQPIKLSLATRSYPQELHMRRYLLFFAERLLCSSKPSLSISASFMVQPLMQSRYYLTPLVPTAFVG